MKKIQGWLMGGATPRSTKREGQAILLIAFAAIILLAFMGVAIDGGRLLFLQRDAQNASDAAGISAGYALCTGDYSDATAYANLVTAAARESAELNGFVHNVDDTEVIIETPIDAADATDNNISCPECAARIEISRQIDKAFIQLVYDGPFGVTTETFVSCDPDANLADRPIDPANEVTKGDGTTVEAPGMMAVYGHCEVQLSGAGSSIVGNMHTNGANGYQMTGSAVLVPVVVLDPVGAIFLVISPIVLEAIRMRQVILVT